MPADRRIVPPLAALSPAAARTSDAYVPSPPGPPGRSIVTSRPAIGFSACKLVGALAYQATPARLRGQFMRVIREVKPDIVFTWDPFTPYENHPDHRAVAMAACEAASFAHFPLYHPELLAEGLEPHKVQEIWLGATRDPNHWLDIEAVLRWISEAGPAPAHDQLRLWLRSQVPEYSPR